MSRDAWAYVEFVDNGRKMYKCPLCDFTHKYCSHIQQHLDIHLPELPPSEDLPYKCSQCRTSYKNSTTLRRHINGVHNNMRPCSWHDCTFAAPTELEISEHWLRHVKHEFVCPHCELNPTSAELLEEHLKHSHAGLTEELERRNNDISGSLDKRRRRTALRRLIKQRQTAAAAAAPPAPAPPAAPISLPPFASLLLPEPAPQPLRATTAPGVVPTSLPPFSSLLLPQPPRR